MLKFRLFYILDFGIIFSSKNNNFAMSLKISKFDFRILIIEKWQGQRDLKICHQG